MILMVTVSCRLVLVVMELMLLSPTVMEFKPVTHNQFSEEEEDKEEEQVTLTGALSNTVSSSALVSKVTSGNLSPFVCGYMQTLHCVNVIVGTNDPFEKRHRKRC